MGRLGEGERRQRHQERHQARGALSRRTYPQSSRTARPYRHITQTRGHTPPPAAYGAVVVVYPAGRPAAAPNATAAAVAGEAEMFGAVGSCPPCAPFTREVAHQLALRPKPLGEQ